LHLEPQGCQLKYFFSEVLMNSIPSAVQLHFYISTWALNFVKEHKTKHNKMTKNIHTDRNIGIQLDVELQKVFGGCCECSESWVSKCTALVAFGIVWCSTFSLYHSLALFFSPAITQI